MGTFVLCRFIFITLEGNILLPVSLLSFIALAVSNPAVFVVPTDTRLSGFAHALRSKIGAAGRPDMITLSSNVVVCVRGRAHSPMHVVHEHDRD